MDEFDSNKKINALLHLLKEDKKIIKQAKNWAFWSFFLSILILVSFLLGFIFIIVGFVCLYNAKMQIIPAMHGLWIAGVCLLCLVILLFIFRVMIQLRIKKIVKNVLIKYTEINEDNLFNKFISFCLDKSNGMFLFLVFNPFISFVTDSKLIRHCNRILHLE